MLIVGQLLKQLQAALEKDDRFMKSEALGGLLSGAKEVFHRLGRISAGAVVVRQLAAVVLQPVAINQFDCVRDAQMELPAAGLQEAAQDGLTDEFVRELEVDLGIFRA